MSACIAAQEEAGVDEPCDDETPCAAGSECAGTTCAPTCATDTACDDAEYCTSAGVCQPDEVPACSSDADCAAWEVCRYGYCAAPSDIDCTPSLNGDVCGTYGLCVDTDSDGAGQCTTAPSCAEDGSCPVGELGAVCNEGYIPGKLGVCLIGFCREDLHCPADTNCVRGELYEVGTCSDGTPGSNCLTDDDCLAGGCIGVSGSVGKCVG